jgi:hypothetical protein
MTIYKPVSFLLSSSSSSPSSSTTKATTTTGETQETHSGSLTHRMIWKTWIPFHHPWGYPVKFDSKLFIIN